MCDDVMTDVIFSRVPCAQMQSHGCLQLAEEVDKEQQKIADKIAERAELVKVGTPDLTPCVCYCCSS
jgi:hypothetical protein